MHSCEMASPAPFPVSFSREDRRPITHETPPEHVTASQIERQSPSGRDGVFARGVDVDFRLSKRIDSLRIWLRGMNLQWYPKGVLKGGVDAFLGAFVSFLVFCEISSD